MGRVSIRRVNVIFLLIFLLLTVATLVRTALLYAGVLALDYVPGVCSNTAASVALSTSWKIDVVVFSGKASVEAQHAIVVAFFRTRSVSAVCGASSTVLKVVQRPPGVEVVVVWDLASGEEIICVSKKTDKSQSTALRSVVGPGGWGDKSTPKGSLIKTISMRLDMPCWSSLKMSIACVVSSSSQATP